MLNSIVGAGIVGIPYALANSGLVVGILLFVLVAYLTDQSTRMIVDLASFHPKLKHLGVYTYEDLARIPFGRLGHVFVMGGMLVLAYGAMVSYLLIIKDTVPTILNISDAGKGSFMERDFVMIVTSLFIVLPLSLLRDLANLKYTSFLSVAADIVMVIFVVIFSPIPSSMDEAGGFGTVLKDNWVNSRVFIGFGVMSFALTVQHSAILVGNSFKDKTPERWSLVTFRAVTTASILCLTMGVFGFLGFLDDTKGNILNNFDSDSVMANVGRGMLAVTMFFTYPMEAYVARHVIVQIFYNGDMDGHTTGPNSEVVELPKLFGVLGRREQVTIGLYLASLVPAVIVNDLGPVLSITGSLGASIVAYVACGMIYLGINGEDFLQYCKEMLQNHGYKADKTPKPSEVELPVVGDATATMSTQEGSNGTASSKDGVVTDTLPQLPSGIKPWWWYVALFPIWTKIATRGAIGTRNFLSQMEGGEPTHEVDLNEDDENTNVVVGPSKKGYYIAMFLIAFGAFASVAGVISNIYVQVHDVFFTPT